MSKWKIDKKNVEIDSNQVDLESAIKKAKWLRIINIICYICTGILFVFFVIGGVRSCTHKKSSSSNATPNAHRVVINEGDGYENFVITTNDYTVSFVSALYNAIGDENTIEFYDSEGGGYSSLGDILFDTSVSFVQIESLNDKIYFNGYDGSDFYGLYYLDSVDGQLYDYGGDLMSSKNIVLNFDVFWWQSNYGDVYDVLINNLDTFDSGIFDAITNTVTNFISTLGVGISSVLVLFYANSQLTVLGTITVIVVGVALVYFLMRFVFGLIRLRG